MTTGTLYKTVFEKSADAYLIIQDAKISQCNASALKMLGYDQPEDIIGTHPALLSPEIQPDGETSLQKGDRMIAKTIAKGSHQFVWTHLRANGDLFEVDVLLTMMNHDGDDLIHCVWRDLTERRKAERILHRTQRMNAVGRLAGGIAHDFNNVLSIIAGNFDLLRKTNRLESIAEKRLDIIEHAIERATVLCRKLLNLAKHKQSELGTNGITPSLLNVLHVIKISLPNNISITADLAQDLWPTITNLGDLEDVVMNMLINSRDAIESKGAIHLATSNISITEVPQNDYEPVPGDYLLISIQDDGSGIPEEIQASIFEPFYTTKGEQHGTGLGLAMVYGFVKRSQGFITVDSKEGKGTVFSIYLPKAVVSDTAEA